MLISLAVLGLLITPAASTVAPFCPASAAGTITQRQAAGPVATHVLRCDFLACLGENATPSTSACSEMAKAAGFESFKVDRVFRPGCTNQWGCFGCGR